MANGLSKLLGGPTSLLVLSVFLLLAFLGLFYADGKVKEDAARLHALTINTEHILNADRAATAAVRMAAGLQDDRHVLNYQEIQDDKKARLAENLKFLNNEIIRQALKSMANIQGDIEDAELEAIGLIDKEKWDDALDLVTEPSFGRSKAIYRSQLSAALREIIRASQEQAEQSNKLALYFQIGVLLTFLVLAVVGFLSLKRQSELAANLSDANENLEQRVRDRTEELKDKQTQFQIAMNNMTDGIYVLDKNLDYLFYNDQYISQVSLPEGTISVGGPVEVAIRAHAARGDYGAGDIDEMVAKRLLVLADSEVIQAELMIDGGRTILDLRKAPIAEGGAVVIITDITESRKAERELAANQAHLRIALDNMPGGMFMVDANLTFQIFNKQYAEFFGLPDDTLKVGGSLREPVRLRAERGDYGSGDLDDLIEQRLSGYTDSKSFRTEERLPNGRTLEFHRQPTGEGGIVAVVTDITERKLAEDTLRQSEAMFQTVLDNIPAAIYLRGSDGRYSLMNEAYREFFGITQEDAYGKTLNDLLPAAQAHEFMAQDREVIEQGRIIEFETVANLDGADRVLATIKFPIRDHDGNVEAVGGVDIDITERKRAEEAIHKQTQLIQLLHSITVSANQSDNIEIALRDCLDAICSYTSWPVGHIYQRLPNDPDTLGSMDIWHLDDPEHFDTFRRISSDATFQRGVGLPGRVFESGEPAWIADVTVDQNFPRAKLAKDIGVRAGFAVPVLVGDEVSAVMEFFAPEAVEPEEALLSVLTNIGNQVGRVVERKQTEEMITKAHELITDSISYAARIQRSILPEEVIMSAVLQDYFIIWEPRDVVGGDIYWAGAWGDGFLVVLGDCTGHGVPGAFMTLIAMGALERARTEIDGGDVGALLSRTHQYVQVTLSQHYEGGESDDGIELGACYFVPDEPELIFAGARFELMIADDTEVKTLKGTKAGAGYRGIPYDQAYDDVKINLQAGQRFYMTSDGLIDQIGGNKRRAFGKRRLRELLIAGQDFSFEDQKQQILSALNTYQGQETRRDDVSVIGFRIY